MRNTEVFYEERKRVRKTVTFLTQIQRDTSTEQTARSSAFLQKISTIILSHYISHLWDQRIIRFN